MKVSIITVSFNSADTIKDTIESVIKQNYRNIEYIIVDGGSTDNTLDIINNFSTHIHQWVSEPDQGIYDAMNKGIQMATGDIIAILNSDDFYVHTEVISNVVKHFKRTKVDTVYGNIQYVNRLQTSKIVRHWVSGVYRRKKFIWGWMPPHPAFFVRKNIYHSHGSFDTRLQTSADYEFMLRVLFKHKVSSGYIPELLVRMRMGGASNRSIKKRLVANWEDRQAWKLNGLQPYFFTAFLKPLRKINQFFMHTIESPPPPSTPANPKKQYAQ